MKLSNCISVSKILFLNVKNEKLSERQRLIVNLAANKSANDVAEMLGVTMFLAGQ